MPTATAPSVEVPRVPQTLSLEITYGCNLSCTHCFAGSGPGLGHGTMSLDDWLRLIDVAAKAGVSQVQVIGGEASLHPDMPTLVRHALAAGLGVEIYTNLTHVSEDLWELYGLPEVQVATSYYSPNRREHDRVTRRRGSHARTRSNIVEALRRGIPLRVGVIDAASVADAIAAEAELRAMGVTRIGRDHVRPFGRAAAAAGITPGPAGLCGRCGTARAAILPDGELVPCGMGRWLSGGNVRDAPLDELLAGERWREAVAVVPPRPAGEGCGPDDSSDCDPASQKACQPDYDS